MTGMFKVADPSEARGNSVTVREILDKASNAILKGLGQDPQVQAQMMQVMASTYMNLGLYSRAHDLAKAALQARLALLGPEDRDTLASRELLAWSGGWHVTEFWTDDKGYFSVFGLRSAGHV